MRAILILMSLAAAPSGARNTQPVVLTISFENESWFPLTKKEMEKSMVDTALQEMTGAALIELTDEGEVLAGRLEIVGALVERAETGKVTITFTAHKVPTLVTTASVSLHDMNHDGIFRAMSGVGREAGRKMRTRLLAVIPPEKADIALVEMLGKDWDNRTTADLYGKAQEFKRGKRFDEAKEIFKVVSARKDRGSQQWKRLADDELDFGLPMFEAHEELLAAAERRRPADLARIEKLYRYVLEKNKGNEARVAEAQRGLDTVQQLRSAMGMVDRSEIRSRVRSLQVAMASQFMETAQAPSLADLKMMAPSLFENADVNDFKMDPKSNDYSFEIVNKKTGFSAVVKGNMMRVGGEGLTFKELN
jgi:hypothetical protein